MTKVEIINKICEYEPEWKEQRSKLWAKDIVKLLEMLKKLRGKKNENNSC